MRILGYRKVLGEMVAIRRHEPTDSFTLSDKALQHAPRDRVQVMQVTNGLGEGDRG